MFDNETADANPPIEQVEIGGNLSKEKKAEVRSLLEEYADVFAIDPKKPARTKLTEHRIITPNAQPVYVKPRRNPFAWETDIDRQIQDMLANDIIRPSTSPWNAPTILVRKKNGVTRLVCDYRELNKVTKKDTYPLPHVKDVLDKMHGAVYWSTLDAASAYWAMPHRETDKEKTAFSVKRGKYEFNVTPFGLANAGTSYQRLMDITLSGLPPGRILAYMDDIVVLALHGQAI